MTAPKSRRPHLSRDPINAIVCVRNGETFPSGALDSIARQTHPAGEVIVIDGQSSDQTARIAKFRPDPPCLFGWPS